MGYACSRDLNYPQKVDWYWSNTNLARPLWKPYTSVGIW